MYANARHGIRISRDTVLSVSAMMNVNPDMTVGESEEGEGVWRLIQILF